jgi:hypothetical protein
MVAQTRLSVKAFPAPRIGGAIAVAIFALIRIGVVASSHDCFLDNVQGHGDIASATNVSS